MQARPPLDQTPKATDAPAYFDAHCHLDFSSDALSFISYAAHNGIGCFSNTVVPADYLAFRDMVGELPAHTTAHVHLGLGAHPWWVANGSCDAKALDVLCELAPSTRCIGEIGLDFAPRRIETRDAQTEAFARIVGACSNGGHVVSIHAVRSATVVLDILERHRSCERNACIMHWFSGSSSELARALHLGCYVSLGTRMLATKRGRAYARAIPRDRLLVETDLPESRQNVLTPKAWFENLKDSLALLGETLGCDATSLVASTSARLFGR